MLNLMITKKIFNLCAALFAIFGTHIVIHVLITNNMFYFSNAQFFFAIFGTHLVINILITNNISLMH